MHLWKTSQLHAPSLRLTKAVPSHNIPPRFRANQFPISSSLLTTHQTSAARGHGQSTEGSTARMRKGRRIARFVFWSFILCVCSLAGGLWFLYWYITDSETIAGVIREHGARYFPRAILE